MDAYSSKHAEHKTSLSLKSEFWLLRGLTQITETVESDITQPCSMLHVNLPNFK